jgi:hypothetical protein
MPHRGEGVADIFVSYTSDDRDWAFWIGQELLRLGHAAHAREWEIKGSEDIYGWMQQRIEAPIICSASRQGTSSPPPIRRGSAMPRFSGREPSLAAVYCERLEMPLATYQKRYEAASVSLLADVRDAPITID